MKRLGHVIDGPRRKGRNLLLGFLDRSHEDHRDGRPLRVRLDALAGFKAGEPRHHRIHQDRIGGDDTQTRQGLLTVAGDQDGIALIGKSVAQHAQGIGGVVHHQHAAHVSCVRHWLHQEGPPDRV